jgi:hypothetical protein
MSLANDPARLRYIRDLVGSRWEGDDVRFEVWDVSLDGAEASILIEATGETTTIPTSVLEDEFTRIPREGDR